MATEYTLPYDPALLLSDRTKLQLSVNNSDTKLYKGAGEKFITTIDDEYSDEELAIEVTTETLFFIKDGVPRAFKPAGYTDYLTDGTASLTVNSDGDYDIEHYIETLAVSQRNEISNNPFFLVDKRGGSGGGYMQDYRDWISPYRPYVLIFNDRVDIHKKIGLREDSRTYIDEENNDYWESAFQYDINQDGFIPEYRTFELYTRPTKNEVNGKVIEGTKRDEVLDGGKLDDHIDGKKGNDIVNGKKGNDALFGSKGRDQLYGSQGDDYLSGGSGDDILEGGSGADIFALSSGNDRITDFNIEDGDKIAIQSKHVGDFEVTSTELGSLVSVEGYGSLIVDVSLEGIDLVSYIVQAV